MGTIANLMIEIGVDPKGTTSGLSKVQYEVNKTASSMKSFGGTLTKSVTLPILGAAAASFKLASDLNESLNKVDVAFKDSAKSVLDWGNTTLENYGIAKGTALDMAALFGDMSTSMGLSTKEASKMSMSLVGLAGDLASFKNIGIDQATTALAGIFTGETESLKSLGIVMTETNLDAFALSKGYTKLTKDMTESEKVQLRYAYIIDKTKNAQGDFSRTSDGAANQMRIFTESLKELGATFGTEILPVITPIIKDINELIQKFGDLDAGTRKNIIVFGLFAASLGPLISGAGSVLQLATNIKTLAAASTAANTAMGASGAAGGMTTFATSCTAALGPIALVAAAIGGLLVLSYELSKQEKILNPNMWNQTATSYQNTANNLMGGSAGGFGDFRALDSYAKGTPFVPKTGLYELHKGEAVTPASQNKGAGLSITITGNTISNQYDIRRIASDLVAELKLKGIRV